MRREEMDIQEVIRREKKEGDEGDVGNKGKEEAFFQED